jgi:hypothetical protein
MSNTHNPSYTGGINRDPDPRWALGKKPEMLSKK